MGYYTYVCALEEGKMSDFNEEVGIGSLPPRQRDVVNHIVQLTEEHGYPPTLAELAAAMGLRNRMTIHQHVAALKKKGVVHWEPGLNRSLKLVGAPKSSLSKSTRWALATTI